jgi:hypothetical protein
MDRIRIKSLGRLGLILCGLGFLLWTQPGCSSIRVTDPMETADQQFLESEATRLAINQISTDQLRDRKVFVDPTYLAIVQQSAPPLAFTQTPQPYLFLLAELRSKLLLSGARLVDRKEDAEIVVEARTGGISVNHLEMLIGLASITIPTEGVASVPFTTPELAILKSTKQYGYASVAFVAYWRDTGEIAASSGPFVGRTAREDYWILGFGPNTVGNVPPAQRPISDYSTK